MCFKNFELSKKNDFHMHSEWPRISTGTVPGKSLPGKVQILCIPYI
jgi:hypothetical protein